MELGKRGDVTGLAMEILGPIGSQLPENKAVNKVEVSGQCFTDHFG